MTEVANIGGVVVVEAIEEDVRAAIRAAKRKAALDRSRRAAQLAPGGGEMSERVLGKLRAAAEARAKAAALRIGGRQNRRAIKAHEDAAKILEREADEMRRADLDAAWLHDATQETLGLAQARGEEVEGETVEMATFVTDEHGVRLRHKAGPRKGQPVLRYERITRAVLRSRGGGLEQALEKGRLDGGRGAPKAEALFATGERYRDSFEVHEGRTTSQGGGAAGFGPKGPQVRQVEAGEALAIMREGLTRRQRAALDNVCGLGMSVAQAAKAVGAGVPATERALRGGLTTAMENWKAAREQKKIGEASVRVKRAHRMLSRLPR